METDDELLILAVKAALSTVITRWRRRRAARNDAEAARLTQRDEVNAHELLVQMRSIYGSYHQVGPMHPSEEPDVRDLVADAEHCVLALTHPEARAEMERVLEVLGSAGMLWCETDVPIAHVAWQAQRAGKESLGALIRGERVEPSAMIARYVSVLEDARRRYVPPAEASA